MFAPFPSILATVHFAQADLCRRDRRRAQPAGCRGQLRGRRGRAARRAAAAAARAERRSAVAGYYYTIDAGVFWEIEVQNHWSFWID